MLQLVVIFSPIPSTKYSRSSCKCDPSHKVALNVAGLTKQSKEFGFEGTLRIIQFQPPCCGLGHLHSSKVAQAPVYPDWTVLGVGPFLGNQCQWLVIVIIQIIFPRSNLNPPCFSLELLPLVTCFSSVGFACGCGVKRTVFLWVAFNFQVQ